MYKERRGGGEGDKGDIGTLSLTYRRYYWRLYYI